MPWHYILWSPVASCCCCSSGLGKRSRPTVLLPYLTLGIYEEVVGGERPTRQFQAMLWVEEDRCHLSATGPLPLFPTPFGSACINQQLLAGDFVPVNSHTQVLAGTGCCLLRSRLPAVELALTIDAQLSTVAHSSVCTERGWTSWLRMRTKRVLVSVSVSV